MVGQVNREYETRDERVTKYVSLVTRRLGNIAAWQLAHVSRDSNEKANALAVVAATLPIKKNAPTRLLPSRVVNCNQSGKRNRRNVSLLDDSNSPLFELEGTTG